MKLKTVGDRLKALRLEKGITLKKLAEDLNSTEATISRYENNVHYPKLETLSDLADYFNTTIDFLTCRTESRFQDNWYSKLPDELKDFIKLENIEYLEIVLDAKEEKLNPETIKQIISAIKGAKKNM